MQFNTTLDSIRVYEAGKPIELVVREYGIPPKSVIKLASNENPHGSSKKAIKAIKKASKEAYRYPDDSMFVLKNGLCARFGIMPSNLIIGAGSDQVLEFCVRAKCKEGSKVLMAKTTFAMYEVYAKQVGALVFRTPSDQHNLDEFKTIYKKEGADIIFLCLPNNPLGECLDRKDVYDFLREVNPETLVVIDGAYQEYAAYKDKKKKIDPTDLIERFPNAIYLGTFSKAYGLGGMRVGYGIAQEEIIGALLKMRPPFNVSTLSLVGAIESLSDKKHVDFSIRDCFDEMALYEAFAKKHKIEFIPSYTNFVTLLLDGLASSTEVSQWLLERGVIVRNLASYGMNAIRITIGGESQNRRFFKLFAKYLKKTAA